GGVQVPGSIRYGIGRLSARRRQELVVRTPVARFWRPRAAWRVENRRLTNGRAAACKKAVAPGISLLQTAAPPETEAMRPATGMELSFRVLLDGCLTVEEQFAAGAGQEETRATEDEAAAAAGWAGFPALPANPAAALEPERAALPLEEEGGAARCGETQP